MIHGLLERVKTSDGGTFGFMSIQRGGSNLILRTGELPWRGNAKNVSCIPAGTYIVQPTLSHRFQRKLFEVMAVPKRSGIRFHVGNYCGDKEQGFLSDVEGCILPGFDVGILRGQPVVLQSTGALEAMHKFLEFNLFKLTIMDKF